MHRFQIFKGVIFFRFHIATWTEENGFSILVFIFKRKKYNVITWLNRFCFFTIEMWKCLLRLPNILFVHLNQRGWDTTGFINPFHSLSKSSHLARACEFSVTFFFFYSLVNFIFCFAHWTINEINVKRFTFHSTTTTGNNKNSDSIKISRTGGKWKRYILGEREWERGKVFSVINRKMLFFFSSSFVSLPWNDEARLNNRMRIIFGCESFVWI